MGLGILRLNRQLLSELFRLGAQLHMEVVKGPRDLEVITTIPAYADVNNVCLLVQSPEIANVDYGTMYPSVEVEFRNIPAEKAG